ncbi:uncharacterized protein LOC119106147 [Pollicipes pollicipes]|uniref:uncharacterized protein LOC119106147 n=1 Tax=Pollicipes pollicipes TaxID=41117 RepID=UPI0018851A94|nr:uncharacterized protein LOC119106147 [Pollicipes pollicipes]
MKLLVVLAVLGAAAAAEDQKADDATLYSTYAAHPLGYTAGYPYALNTHPTVYNSAYRVPTTYAYNGFSAYNGYTPIVHSLKKRDTAEADQKADDATLISTYAAHPVGYTAGYPYALNTYPTVYNSAYSVPTTYAYNGFSAYNGYTPIVHSLKKRDTAEADQKADDATLISTYAAHPVGYPYAHAGYSTPYAFRSVYNTPASTHPITYNAFPYAYRSHVY